jgi:hypothetical protein
MHTQISNSFITFKVCNTEHGPFKQRNDYMIWVYFHLSFKSILNVHITPYTASLKYCKASLIQPAVLLSLPSKRQHCKYASHYRLLLLSGSIIIFVLYRRERGKAKGTAWTNYVTTPKQFDHFQCLFPSDQMNKSHFTVR